MRLRELYETIQLDENYNGKLNKLKKEFPDLAADIDARLAWAQQAFKNKNQAVMWYLTLFEAWLKQSTDPTAKALYDSMLGGFPPFNDFSVFETNMNHWLTSRYADQRLKSTNKSPVQDAILKIRAPSGTAASTTVASLVQELQAAEAAIQKDDEASKTPIQGVDILPGDQVVLPLGNQGDWWLLPTNKHTPESKFMGHCGTASKDTNVLLSLRDKTPLPYVTMEYDKDQGILYQMKGRNNSKPANKFHYAIMALLQSNLVNGLYTGRTYQPANDFSIFDMKPELIAQLINNNETQNTGKEQLIFDQITKYPIDMLRDSAKIVRQIPRFKDFAISKLPGLSVLIGTDGTVSTDSETWERAIADHPEMIIYSPVALKDWEQRVTDYLVNHSSDLGYCGNHIRSNYNIMKTVITESRASAIELVPYRVPHYKELALLAIGQEPKVIKSINTEGWSTEEIKQAWMEAATEYYNTPDWPTDLFTPNDEKDIWRTMIKNSRYAISKLPPGLFNQNELVDLWSYAATTHPALAISNDFINLDISEEAKDQIRISTVFAHPQYIADFRPDLIENEEDRVTLWTAACIRSPDLIHSLDNVLISDKDKSNILVQVVYKHPAYISDIDQNLIPDVNERLDLWIKACKFNPKYKEAPKFPEREFSQNIDKVKELWFAMAETEYKFMVPSIADIPTEIFTPEELHTLIRRVIERDPSQVIYAPASIVNLKERTAAVKKLLADGMDVLQIKHNPVSPEFFTPNQIKKLWEDPLNNIVNHDEGDDEEEDNSYIIASKWLPYHLVDHNLLKSAIWKVATTDYAENDSILNRMNYNLLDQLYTPEELFNLHRAVIEANQCNAENGGSLAAVPLKYRTYELCKFALEVDPQSNIDAVVASQENFTDDEYEALINDAGNPQVDDYMVGHIRTETYENAEFRNFIPLQFGDI